MGWIVGEGIANSTGRGGGDQAAGSSSLYCRWWCIIHSVWRGHVDQSPECIQPLPLHVGSTGAKHRVADGQVRAVRAESQQDRGHFLQPRIQEENPQEELAAFQIHRGIYSIPLVEDFPIVNSFIIVQCNVAGLGRVERNSAWALSSHLRQSAAALPQPHRHSPRSAHRRFSLQLSGKQSECRGSPTFHTHKFIFYG